jgi:hypothetical protein
MNLEPRVLELKIGHVDHATRALGFGPKIFLMEAALTTALTTALTHFLSKIQET